MKNDDALLPIPFDEMELRVCAICGHEGNRGRWVRVPVCYGKWYEDEWHCRRCGGSGGERYE